MKDSEFFSGQLQLLYYKYHKINPVHDGSFICSPDLIKSEKAIINPINKKDNKCFQYVVTVVLNHDKIAKNPGRIIKIKSLVNKYKWKGKIFLLEKEN